MSAAAGSVPKVRPQSPARREAQKASATGGGLKRINNDAWRATASLSAARRAPTSERSESRLSM